MSNLGTRSKATTSQNFQERCGAQTKLSRDVGMSKRVVTTATFTSSNGRITGSANDFLAFLVGDPIVIYGAVLNSAAGHSVVAIDGASHAFLQFDQGVKDEGPISVEVRTE